MEWCFSGDFHAHIRWRDIWMPRLGGRMRTFPRHLLVCVGGSALGVLAFLSIAALGFLWLRESMGEADSFTLIATPQSDPEASRRETTSDPISSEGSPVGESYVPPSFTVRKLPPPLDPKAPLGSYLEEFKRRAKAGDSEAAYAVFLGLSRCSDAPRTKADAERLQMLAGPMAASIPDDPLEDPRDWSPALLYDYCHGVVPQDPGQAYDYLDLAAALGNPRAQIGLAGHMPPASTSSVEVVSDSSGATHNNGGRHLREIQYLEEARDAGMVEAFLSLAVANGATSEVMRNPVAAYGYLLAADAAYRNAALPNASRSVLQTLEARLRPNELAEARRFADQLLANPACCQL